MPSGHAYIYRVETVTKNFAEVIRVLANGNQSEAGRKCKIDPKTLNRIARGLVMPSMQNLFAFAKGFDLEPWQLLVPNLDPANPPILKGVSAKEQELWVKLMEAKKALSNLGEQ